jgi:tRNA A37 methylthiotransferase MiaB
LKKVFKKSQTANKLQDTLSNYLEKKLLHKKSTNYHESIFNYISAKYIKEKWNPNYKIYKDAYFIRPSWGCLSNCSYCVIKNAIGPLKSKSLDTVITEFKNGLNLKYDNFILDADDTGAYGIDIGATFPELLDKITDIPSDYKIYIRNIHPVWIVKYIDELENILRKNKIKGIGCSIQSGNTRILKLMQRYPDTEKIMEAFYKLFENYPDLILATECINGFPTETKDEFEDTLDFIEKVDFSFGYIFPFSCRSGTGAEKLNPKIPDDEISHRMGYARKYLKKIGYSTSFIKNYKILLFTKDSSDFEIDDHTKLFCLSTID